MIMVLVKMTMIMMSAKVHLDDKLAVTTDSMKIGGNRDDDRQASKHIG